VIAALLVAAALACTPPSDGTVVGFWESTSTTRGGIGQAIEPKPSGEMVTSTTFIVDQAYRAADGKLALAEGATKLDTPTGETTFKIVNGVFLQSDGEGGEIRKERLGTTEAGADSIVGAWRYRHYTGAIAFERYTTDGRLLFRLPMTSQTSCYQATDTTVTVETPGRATLMTYTVAGSMLTLRSSDGKSYGYRRADPWYPRDQIDYRPPTGR
jgi:hypothetical protein